MARIAVIAFPHLLTDRVLRLQPQLEQLPFVLAEKDRGRRVVKAINALAQKEGAQAGMVLADAKATIPGLEVLEYEPQQAEKILNAMAEWSIRFAPYVSVDLPDSLIIDASGCTHLWGGEKNYIEEIHKRFKAFGYHNRVAIADTIGAAWALSRFGKGNSIIEPGKQAEVLSQLPPSALRLDEITLEKLRKLGLQTIGSFMKMPGTALRRRFGQSLLTRLAQALGYELEITVPVRPIPPYEERLPCLDPIVTAPGIEIALKNLLEELCKRLVRESKGLRKAELRCYRLDGNVQSIAISTSRASRNVKHLFKLFEDRIQTIEPDLGIELFVLEASVVEELLGTQDSIWSGGTKDATAIAELIDRITTKIGPGNIHRYLPEEHSWPERSIKATTSLSERPKTEWRKDLPRPLHILPEPYPIDVSAPIPDYPPMLFRYKGELHKVSKADGPERIEQEWWIQPGLYRDYYCVEDERGARFWLFRSGDYASGKAKWFIHGFFA